MLSREFLEANKLTHWGTSKRSDPMGMVCVHTFSYDGGLKFPVEVKAGDLHDQDLEKELLSIVKEATADTIPPEAEPQTDPSPKQLEMLPPSSDAGETDIDNWWNNR